MKSPALLSNKWFVRPHVKPEATTRLFFFPYAGGGPTVFTKWCADLPRHIEGTVVHYPGRGSRFDEPAIDEMPRMTDALAQNIEPLLDKPFSLFGHSMGGLIAYELARHLRAQHLPMPSQLFISACGTPQLTDSTPKIHSLPDDQFLNEFDQLDGIPREMQNPEVLRLLLPIFRADMQLLEDYAYYSGAPLDLPIVAFGALDDSRVSRERIEGWASHTSGGFEARYFSGGHFYLREHRRAIIKIIDEKT